jgi:hypothetical protein
MVYSFFKEFDLPWHMTATVPLSHHLDLYRYWESLGGNHRTPTRRDINPADILPLLPHIALIEAVGGGAYRWRLIGSHIVDDLGCDLTGQPFGQNVRPEPYVSRMTATFDRVLDQRQPVFEESIYTIADERTHNVSRLLLPLAADGPTCAMILLTRITRRRPLDRALNYIKGASGQIYASLDIGSADDLERRVVDWDNSTQPAPVARIAPRPVYRIANLWGDGLPLVVQCERDRARKK